MNYKIWILAISSLTVGLVELIVGGILPVIAEDFQVSIGSAGQLITIYASVYAIASPILLSITARVERKKCYLITLAVFLIGNILSYFSPNFTIMMISRIMTALSASLIIALSLTITARIATPEHRAKALGLIYMGISSSLVLGVPIGVIITDWFGWRAIFLGIAMMTVIALILSAIFLDRMMISKVHSLSTQIKSLGNFKVVFAHFVMIFMLAGHYTIYAYFTPFLEYTMQLNQYWISISYFIFGLSAVSGGAIGGILADRMGSGKSMTLIVVSFAVVLFILPYVTFSYSVFVGILILWGILSWAISPPVQKYIIETDEQTSDIHQSLNNSAIQVGIAIGSGIGGIVIESTGSVIYAPTVGSIIIGMALICVIYMLGMYKRKTFP